MCYDYMNFYLTAGLFLCLFFPIGKGVAAAAKNLRPLCITERAR